MKSISLRSSRSLVVKWFMMMSLDEDPIFSSCVISFWTQMAYQVDCCHNIVFFHPPYPRRLHFQRGCFARNQLVSLESHLNAGDVECWLLPFLSTFNNVPFDKAKCEACKKKRKPQHLSVNVIDIVLTTTRSQNDEALLVPFDEWNEIFFHISRECLEIEKRKRKLSINLRWSRGKSHNNAVGIFFFFLLASKWDCQKSSSSEKIHRKEKL